MITIEIRPAIKANSDLSLFMSFPYDNTVLNIVRALPNRFWDANAKTWEVPFNKLGKLISDLTDYEIEIKANDATIFAPKVVAQPDYKFKTTPFQHQIDGFKYGMENDRWLLGDEQGLGKTKQVIDIAVAKKIQKGYEHCLIICGVNGLKWNWQAEISTHSDETGWILGQRKGTNGKVKIGSTNDKLHDLNHLPDSYFLITNVESLRDGSIVTKLQELCKNKVIGLVAADECHKMKNPSSQQGKGFLKVQAETMIAMTGTPLMNTPMDLYIILKWLGYEDHSFSSFKNHYCIMGGYGGYQIVGYRHLDNLQAKLNDIMLRRLKADVLDLPDKVFVDEYVELTSKQAQLYKEIALEIQANIDMVKMATNPLAEMIRLRQATGYTGILSSTIQESAKLDRMVEIVDDAVDNGKKVVIFSNWTQMTDVVVRKIKEKYDYSIITGNTSDSARQQMVNNFQNDPNCKVIIGTIGAMGTGLTLTAGTVEIFLDEPWTMAAKDQAVDRCHRIGATESVTVYTLLSKNTIDERIHELVYKKGKMANAMVDGDTITKEDMVDFLLS